MIDKLRLINDKLIEINQNNQDELQKQILIKKMLSDDKCFLKVDIETAYSILKDLQISDDLLKKVYTKLIDIENF